MEDLFKTETHNNDINEIYKISSFDIEKEIFDKKETKSMCKVYARFFKRMMKKYFHFNTKSNFKTILLITTKKTPIDFISAFRKQYPNKKFQVLIPIDNTDDYQNTNFSFEFFNQNKMNSATLYKLKKSEENIEVYGLYSEAFSEKDLTKFQNLVPYIKASRITAKKLKPEIVHADNIPFYLGTELEPKTYYPFKVLQIIEDFSLYESNKQELFWSAINLADKKTMKKICQDEMTKKCIAKLFNLHHAKRFYQMKECLEFVYKNYYKFRKYVDKCDDIDENIIFNRLNARISKILPSLNYSNDTYYNIMYNSIKKANFWAVPSETYYKELILNPNLSGKMFNLITKTKNKSSFIKYGAQLTEAHLYKNFNVENFRDYRIRNKKYILREFSKDRIAINFIDPKLFQDSDYKIKGYLDSFYEAPLIFCKLNEKHLSLGADVALVTILKLFENYKNVQVIINMENGFENHQLKTWCEIIEQTNGYSGKWIVIDGKINLEQFYASADIAFFTSRHNIVNNDLFISMKYGCIPIATKNGIFNDSISDIFDDMTYGCGFKTKNYNTENENLNEIFHHTVSKAINLYHNNPASWNLLIKNAMSYDASWNFEIIEHYNKIYDKMK